MTQYTKNHTYTGDRFNAAILEDDLRDTEALSEILKEYADTNHLNLTLHAFSSAKELLSKYRPDAYSVLFLDIYLDDMTGLDLAKEIYEMDHHAAFVFVTSSEKHRSDAFALHAYDYVNKPADKERIAKICDGCLLRHQKLSLAPKLILKTGSVPYTDIACVRVSGHDYLDITCATGEEYHTLMAFQSVEELLTKEPQFLLIQRGTLVNMDYVVRFHNGFCETESGLTLEVNPRNADELEAVWTNYKLDNIHKERKARRRVR